jgi:hypothetical protein
VFDSGSTDDCSNVNGGADLVGEQVKAVHDVCQCSDRAMSAVRSSLVPLMLRLLLLWWCAIVIDCVGAKLVQMEHNTT